jgi:hypothetical protein
VPWKGTREVGIAAFFSFLSPAHLLVKLLLVRRGVVILLAAVVLVVAVDRFGDRLGEGGVACGRGRGNKRGGWIGLAAAAAAAWG